MPDLFQQQSALMAINFGVSEVDAPRIEETSFPGFINLRGRLDHSGFCAAILTVLGCEPPAETNTMREAGDYRIYWLGPDEWLVVTPTGRAGELQTQLQTALSGVFSSVVDNSSGLVLFKITGDHAADLLASDCPLDLHPRVFKYGQCAQTRLAKTSMIIAPLRDGNGFEMIIRRSYADYIGRWLQDALQAFV